MTLLVPRGGICPRRFVPFARIRYIASCRRAADRRKEFSLHHVNRTLLRLAVGLGLCVHAGPAAAQAGAVLDRVYLSSAIPLESTEFGARWDYPGLSSGPQVDYYDDLGLPHFDESQWKAGVTLADSHRLQATRWKIGNAYRGRTTRPITIDGSGFSSGTAISNSLDAKIETLSYTWFLAKDARQAWGIGLGTSRVRIENKLSAIVEGFPGEFEIDSSASERVTLPHVRAEYARRIGDWRVGADASLGRRSGDRLAARSQEASVSLEYLPASVMAIGVRYSIHRTELERNNPAASGMPAPASTFSGNFRIRSATPHLYITLRY